MAIIRIHEKPNAVPNNAAVFAIEMEVGGVWYTRKVTWEQLTGLIAALNNLQNYYLKTETYTKTEVNQLIAAIPTFSVEIVQALPTEDISTTTLYLVPKTTAGTLDYYDEYINLDGTTSGWEYVGKTEIDLSNYYTKAETEAYVKGDGADYIAGTKTFNSLTTTAKNILGAINEAAGAASGAQADATQALADASAAQGTANSASSAASAAQGTADNALTAAGNAANAASAAQGAANTALTTAQSMAVSVTNTLTPGDTTKKVADVTQNSTTASIYADDAEKVVVALTDEQTTAPGNPVTLTTVQEGGAKSALVTFAPKQSGTGDPSPSNIRPISGWDGLTLTVSDGDQQEDEYTATFPDTIMGGSYDFVSGDGTISNLVYMTFSSASYYGTFGVDDAPLFYVDISGYNITRMNQATTSGIILSNMLTKITESSADKMKNYEIRTEATSRPTKLYFRMDDFTDETSINAFLAQNPLQILATTKDEPTPITLTPADVNLLKGSNTVWTDGDTVQIKYSELPNGNLGAVIDYIKTLEARVKALES